LASVNAVFFSVFMLFERMSEKLTISVGGVPEHFNLPWLLAIEESAFNDLGIEVRFQEFGGGTGAMAAAIDRRQIDLAMLLTEGCLAEQLKGSQICMVKSFVTSPLIWGIHVAADSDIFNVDQIQNKRYAVSRFGSGSHLMAMVDAAERGWPTENLRFVQVNDLKGARKSLAARQSDIFFWEQFTTFPYIESGEFRRLDIRLAPWPAFVIAAHPDFLDKNSDIVKQILSIVNQYCHRLMQGADTVNQVVRRYGLKRDQVEEWFQRTRWSLDFQVPADGIESAHDYLRRLGLVGENQERDSWERKGIWRRL